MSGVANWSVDVSAANLADEDDWFMVTNGVMEARDVDQACIWMSVSIDISGHTDVSITADASEEGTMASTEYIRFYYKLDGGAETLFETNGDNSDDFTSVVASQTGLNGSSLEIVVKADNNYGTRYHRFDNIAVEGTVVDPNAPVVVITDPAGETAAYPFDTNSVVVSGTASNAVGTMLWTNALTGSSGTTAAGATWNVGTVALNVGTNPITVTATNAAGTSGDDTINLIRYPEGVFLQDDFEDGDLAGWIQTPAAHWGNSADSPINGSQSLKHALSGVESNSSISFATALDVAADSTSWRFNLKNGSWAPSGGNRFHVTGVST